jgi:HEAT repeat protein
MSKRFTIGLLVFFAGVAGNLIAGWLQQGKWAIQPTTEQFLGMLAGAGLILFVVALLKSERALAWNWRWHRFWYLRELLKNPDLRHWETDFARLEMVPGRRKIFGAEVIAEGKRQDMVEMLHELIIGRQEKTPRVLVLGEPGSGKTTGLERLTLDLARAGSRRLGIGCKMPVLLRLGNFQQRTLLDYAAQKMEQATKLSSGEILSKGIKKLIRQGRVVLLCDALDEALGLRRDLVLAELKNFLEDHAYQDVPIVITSRTREAAESGLKGLAVFEIQDLNDEAVSVFIHAYKRPEHSEPEITQRLQNHRLLEPGGLGRNPFWLRLIVASGAFEGNKGQILNTAVDTLLAREWDEKPEVQRSWRRVLPRDEQLEETKRALAFLGYWMSAANLFAIEHDGVLMALEKGWLAKREQAGVKGLRPQDILGLGRDAQVLVYDSGPVRFRHRLLQEFMTAWMLMFDKGLLEQEIDRISEKVEWWETLFLLGGLVCTNRSFDAYSALVHRVLGDGTNDQRLFAAIGLLKSVESPPAELANSIMAVFKTSIDKGLTENQFLAAQELGQLLADEVVEIFEIIFHSQDFHTKFRGTRLLAQLFRDNRSKRSYEALFAKLNHDKEGALPTSVMLAGIEEGVEPLIVALKDSNINLRREAASALGGRRRSRDSHAVEPLIAALGDLDSRVRCNAGKALGEIGDAQAVESLIVAMRDPDSDVRSSAAKALGEIGDAQAVESLIVAMRDPDSDVRSSAAKALGKIGDTRAVEPLIAALRDSRSDVRYSAAKALEKISDPRVIEPFIAALYDSNSDVQRIAEKVVVKIGEPAIPALITSLGGYKYRKYRQDTGAFACSKCFNKNR